MSKVLGIVAEYNPFHNGHLYHLEKSKRDTGSDYTVAVISGHFTQRGSTSLLDKWSKTEMALLNGIDLVLELPLLYSISSAENFADGAIKLLDSLHVVDYVSFGIESNSIGVLNKCADVLYHEPKDYRNILSHELAKGLSYPKARENALLLYLNDVRRFANVLSSPNNILGIEYLKALKKYRSPILANAIPRYETGYHDTNTSGKIASATAIRNSIKNNTLAPLKTLLPKSSFSVLMEQIKIGHIVPDLSVFEHQIIYNLRKMDLEEITNLPDVTEGLEFAIKKAANSCNSVIELLSILKSKRYTATRLQRIFLYALFGITKQDMVLSTKMMPYARVLGFSEDRGKFLLSEIARANPNLAIVTSVKRFMDESRNKDLKWLLSKDIWATNVYSIGFEYGSCGNLDFTQKIICV